jgi:hypothetical protein
LARVPQENTMDNDDPGSDQAGQDSIYRAPASETTVVPEGNLLAAYVGPKNADYYARVFERFENGGSIISWNWAAFLVTSFWLLYRKMWLNAFLYWIILPIVLTVLSVSIAAQSPATTADGVYYFLYLPIAFLLMPMFANWIYYRHAQSKVDKVSFVTAKEQRAPELVRIGGTANVVLVIAPLLLVVVLGIVAAIVVPAYYDYSVRAQVSEGLNLAGGARAAVAETLQTTGRLPADNAAVGLPPASQINGAYVSGVAIENGTVYISYGNQAHPTIFGRSIVFTPLPRAEGHVEWSCSSPNIAPKHLPAMCR